MSASVWTVEVTRCRPQDPWAVSAGWIKEIWFAVSEDEAAAVAVVAAACGYSPDAKVRAAPSLPASETAKGELEAGHAKAFLTLLKPTFKRAELGGLLDLTAQQVEEEGRRLKCMGETLARLEAYGHDDRLAMGAWIDMVEGVLAAQIAECNRILAVLDALD
jgi:hypothetical protein